MSRFKVLITQLLAIALLAAPLTVMPVSAQQPAQAKVIYPTDRTILPIPQPKITNSNVMDANDTQPPPRFELKAPDGAPNVLIVMIDDMGFGMSGGGSGKGGTATILVNGKQVATGKIDQTQANVFSADEGADVGSDEGTAVASAYSIPFKFTGKIHKVTVDLKPTTTAEAAEAEKARRETAIRMAGAN